jgi:hypothetical protein
MLHVQYAAVPKREPGETNCDAKITLEKRPTPPYILGPILEG